VNDSYLSIQDIIIPIPLNIHRNIRSITTRNIRLRHQERTPNLSLQKWLQPLLLLLLSPILRKDLHIPRIRGRTIHRLTSNPGFTQILGHETILKIGKASAFLKVVLGQEHVPEAELLGFDLEVFDDLRVGVEAGDSVAAILVDLLGEDGVRGDAFFLDEFFDLDEIVCWHPCSCLTRTIYVFIRSGQTVFIAPYLGVFEALSPGFEGLRYHPLPRHVQEPYDARVLQILKALTMSKVFFALSLTHGLQMVGIRSDAGMCPPALLMRYGNDIFEACYRRQQKR
jgi:hypothetical protein